LQHARWCYSIWPSRAIYAFALALRDDGAPNGQAIDRAKELAAACAK
jgi:hypothetical protein